MAPLDALYHPPRPRGRPPLADRQRNRLTLKLPGAASTNGTNLVTKVTDVKHELEENEAQLEEQFILRVLPEMTAQFNKLVNERKIQDHLEITFQDERNATVKFENKLYWAILVDLPTITESYRTVDKKQLLKTADICQMLKITKQVEVNKETGEPVTGKERVLARGLDVIYPDGLAPSLANVRKERFRRRIPNNRIDTIEREVLRLLEEDAQAMAVKFELSDDLGDESARGATPSIDIMSPVTLDDIYTPRIVDDDAASSVANEDMEFDENLAAELEQGLEELEDEAEEDDDDEEDEDDDDDDDDDDRPSNERSMRMKLLGEDIAELERTIKKKVADLDSAPNPIIRRRFEGVIKQLQEQLSEKQLELEQYQKQVQEENDAELAESLAEKEPENSKTS